MTKEDFLTHRENLKQFIDTIHKVTLLIGLVSFIGYGLAAWIWFQGNNVVALIVVTISYLLFRAFRFISFNFARQKYSTDAATADTMKLIDGQLAEHKPQEVVAMIEGFFEGEKRQNSAQD